MFSCLRESLSKLPGKQQHIIVVGDANVHIDWDNNISQSNSFTKQLDEELLDICSDFNLVQKVKFGTRNENIFDVFLCGSFSSSLEDGLLALQVL